jgi:hypothetical protein
MPYSEYPNFWSEINDVRLQRIAKMAMTKSKNPSKLYNFFEDLLKNGSEYYNKHGEKTTKEGILLSSIKEKSQNSDSEKKSPVSNNKVYAFNFTLSIVIVIILLLSIKLLGRFSKTKI